MTYGDHDGSNTYPDLRGEMEPTEEVSDPLWDEMVRNVSRIGLNAAVELHWQKQKARLWAECANDVVTGKADE